MSSPVRLTLVIPVYNGARFLRSSLQQAHDWLLTQPFPTELLVVDDGSRDDTPAILAEFATNHATGPCTITTLRNEPNRGKGFAVRRAFLHAQGEFVVFTDADLTYPIENCQPLVDALAAGADLAYGNRMHLDSRYVVAPTFFGKLFTRHFMGRTFNLLLRLIVVRGILDSQAGLKGVRREAGRRLAHRVRLTRFSFDVELFFVARRLGMRIADCPVQFLYRKEPTTVHFFRDSLAMVRDMLRVRWRGMRGVYDHELSPAALQDLYNGGKTNGGLNAVAPRDRADRQKTG